ncbi:MAG: RluA family pseudouridine synthase, partial [Vulcanimicrobiaceae bacterium]
MARAIRTGKVLLDGSPPKASALLDVGDRLDFEIPQAEPLAVLPEALPLALVYEDEWLAVVDKPAGLVTHPARGSPRGTLVNALLARYGALPGEPVRAGLVHRLDRDTSGLVLIAKTEEALQALGRAMAQRHIERSYRGIVVGIPEQARGTLDGPLGRDEHHRLRHAVRAQGRPAVTHFELRERLRGASELGFRLETGRTHQIRVHLAAFGHPLLNDPLYGRG